MTILFEDQNAALMEDILFEDDDSAFMEDLNELDDDDEQQQQQQHSQARALNLYLFPAKKGSKILHPKLKISCLLASNKLLLEIDIQIFNLYNLIRDKYRNKFPELESVVQDPIDYARAVKKIGNEKDMSLIDFQGNGLNLSPAILIGVSITASKTSGKPNFRRKI